MRSMSVTEGKAAGSRCRGGRLETRAFASFDAIFSIVPILLMLLYTMNASSFLAAKAQERMERQEAFDKAVSAADYIVRRGGSLKTEGSLAGEMAVYPNLFSITPGPHDYDYLGKRLGISNFSATMDRPGDGGYCVYRIVVVETPALPSPQMEIRTLYVCGD